MSNKSSFDKNFAVSTGKFGIGLWTKYEAILNKLEHLDNFDNIELDPKGLEDFLEGKEENEDEHDEDKYSMLTDNDDNYSGLADAEAEYFKNRFIRYNFNEIFPEYANESESIVIDESRRIQKVLYDIYKDNNNLLTLNCWDFEEMVAELLSKQGYKVELTQKTKDNGYDIIALMNIKMQTPLKFLVECKRYVHRKVGIEVIRSFKEVIDTEKANRGIIVTTSYFTKGALQKQAEIPYLLDYRDKDKVIEWVKDYFNNKVDLKS